MSKNSPDRRIAKTRASLGTALFKLMQSQSWNTITIQEICDTADVARASFYAHFDTKIALLDFLIAKQLASQEFGTQRALGLRDYVAFLSWLIDHLTGNRPLFSRIAQEPESQSVLMRFKQALLTQFASALKRDGLAVTETKMAFVLGGTFDALIQWSRHWKIKQIPQLQIDILGMAARVLESE